MPTRPYRIRYWMILSDHAVTHCVSVPSIYCDGLLGLCLTWNFAVEKGRNHLFAVTHIVFNVIFEQSWISTSAID